jgi:hypothetical protein
MTAKPDSFSYSIRGARPTRLAAYSRPCGCIAALAAWPTPATADGGISSLGALLPLYLTLFSLAGIVAVWLLVSLVVFFTSPAKTTERRLNMYKNFSFVLSGLVLVLAFVGPSFFGGALIFGAFIISMIVGMGAIFVIVRAQKRAKLLTENPESD